MKLREILALVGMVSGILFGGVQTYVMLAARVETIEVTRILAEAAQATAESIGDCGANSR